ncbi:MAG: SpoIIE family protein phosphatase [Chitinophagales bacterium]
MAKADSGLVVKGLLNTDAECGDLAIIKEEDQHCFMALIDVLGHGKDARRVALIASNYIESCYDKDLLDIMSGLHSQLKGTRGAVAALVSFDISSNEIHYVGIGNITVRLYGHKPSKLVPKDGVIGYMMPKPVKQVLDFFPGDVLIMHSDGIKEHFNIAECRDLFLGSAQNIAEGILDRFGKGTDDASCVVLKYIP